MDDSDFLPGEEPNYMRGATKGSTSVYYINGDYHFPGKPILFNSKYIRNFDNFLDHLTNNLKPRFGAVRTVYTPDHGHRVRGMNDISPNKSYVVSGADRFHRFPYASIDQIRKRRNKRTHITYDVPPVVHARHQVSGRIKRCNTTGKVIKCWANGEDVNEPHTVHIPPSLVNEQTWDRIFDLMTISVRDLTGPPVKVYTRQGQEVQGPQELDHMGYYVIAPKFNRFFKDVEYKEVRRANFHTSPLPDRRALPPVRSKNNSKSNSLQSSPDHSWASHPGSENGYTQKHRRNLARQRQEEAQNQGFYAKPTAHKRSGEAKGKPVDLDQDKGGVFKAKNQNRATRGAQEVKESGDTRTEVPIDQRKAEVVSEDIKTNKKGKDAPPANGPRNGRPTRGQQQQQQYEQPPPAKAKTNSYRGPPPPSSNNSHPPASNGIKQNSPPATSTPKTEPKGKEAAKKAKSPSPPPPAPAARQEMSEDEAATKIQAQFRGHQARKGMEAHSPQPQQQQQYHQQQHQARESPRPVQDNQRAPSSQLNNEEMSEEEAATKIQANFRGFKARKEVEEKKATAGAATPQPQQQQQEQQQGRSPSPPQKSEADREEEAATKIQAVYRGHATRQELAARQQQQEQDLKPDGPAASPEPLGQDDHLASQNAREEAAATKIQATFRGHATRRQLQQQGN